MKILDIYARLKKDMNYIEKELEKSIYSDYTIMRETSAHLLKAGGKRIRPVFVLLAGQFGSYQLDQLKNVAVPMELIHMATLVHDDVIDDADTRRGQLTVKSKWDNRIAMYTGDYIFAKALGVVTQLPNPQIHQIMSKAIVGAIAANAPKPVTQKLFLFGYNVGMAFQIRDDLLDLCGTEQQIGKPPGSDIKQGNITIPMLLALQDPALKESLLLEIARIQAADGQTDVSAFIKLIRNSKGISKAEDMAERYIEKAVSALQGLPDLQAKQDLIRIAHFVGNRSY
jgi:heptaprenyl diphosphate synthase